MTYVPMRYFVAPTKTVVRAAHRGFERHKLWAVVDRDAGTFKEYRTRLEAQQVVFELRQQQLADAADSHPQL